MIPTLIIVSIVIIRSLGDPEQSSGTELTARIDQQQTPLTSPQTPRDLVTEIDMPRGVDEVDQVLLSVRMCPEHRYRLCFDSDACERGCER